MKLTVLKGEHNPFSTQVTLKSAAQGIIATVIARAYDQTGANDAAVYFVGQALDFLCLQMDLPLHLSLFRPEFRPLATHIKRRVEEDEWLNAFQLGREYSMTRPYFSRAMSWYRKGVVSEDPIDKLIGFWSALEGIGATCHEKNDRTAQGIINQICNCFDQVWGSADKWQVIPNQAGVINEFYDLRNGIAHGFRRVDIETIRDLVVKLPVYKEIARAFLLSWENSGDQRERQLRREREQHPTFNL